MPYVAIGRISKALESLPAFHAFFGVTFLSMKQSGVTTTEPIVWGSAEERELIDTYYTPPGARPTKPIFIPFGRRDPVHGFWKNPKYSGGTLQRARTTDNFRAALHHPTPAKWAFTDQYLQVLEQLLPRDENGTVTRLPTLDLAAWLFRDRELPGELNEVVKLFRDEFRLQDDAEYQRLFDAGIVDEDPGQFFYADLPDRGELIELVGGLPEGPSLADRAEEEIVRAIEDYIVSDALLALPEGFVRSFYYAIKTQRFVVLAGRPGTGKTTFARAFADALDRVFSESVTVVMVSVGQDFGESDVLGYEKIAGGLAPTELTKALFLSGRQRDLYVVVLDEMNLAHVDHYLARLLPAIESDAPIDLPGADVQHDLPPDAIFVGTANSYIEEATRVPLSGPVKRRANIIEMPNTLDVMVRGDDRAQFEDVIERLLRQCRQRYEQRSEKALASVLDPFRLQDLDAALGNESPILSASFLEILWQLALICSGDPQTSLTLGILQDVVEYVALAGWGDPRHALDYQIAQKLVPQLSGPARIVEAVAEYVKSIRSDDVGFEQALEALSHLLESEDPSSGIVFYRY